MKLFLGTALCVALFASSAAVSFAETTTSTNPFNDGVETVAAGSLPLDTPVIVTSLDQIDAMAAQVIIETNATSTTPDTARDAMWFRHPVLRAVSILLSQIRSLADKVAALDTSLSGALSSIANLQGDVMAFFTSFSGARGHLAGITLYDSATDEPYCVKVTNGSMVTSPGACVEPPKTEEPVAQITAIEAASTTSQARLVSATSSASTTTNSQPTATSTELNPFSPPTTTVTP